MAATQGHDPVRELGLVALADSFAGLILFILASRQGQQKRPLPLFSGNGQHGICAGSAESYPAHIGRFQFRRPFSSALCCGFKSCQLLKISTSKTPQSPMPRAFRLVASKVGGIFGARGGSRSRLRPSDLPTIALAFWGWAADFADHSPTNSPETPFVRLSVGRCGSGSNTTVKKFAHLVGGVFGGGRHNVAINVQCSGNVLMT